MRQGQQTEDYQNLVNQNQQLQQQIGKRKDDIAFLNQVKSQDNEQYNDLMIENGKLKEQIEDLDREFNLLKAKIAEQRRLLD